jgi:hypothetical protein
MLIRATPMTCQCMSDGCSQNGIAYQLPVTQEELQPVQN